MIFKFRALYKTNLLYENHQFSKITKRIPVWYGVCIISIFNLVIKPHPLESAP